MSAGVDLQSTLAATQKPQRGAFYTPTKLTAIALPTQTPLVSPRPDNNTFLFAKEINMKHNTLNAKMFCITQLKSVSGNSSVSF
jgi:hypothetical protein